MSGFVVLHRVFLDWEWYDDINVKVLFLHLILKANHRDKKWRGIDIKRGQTLTSLQSLSGETGLTIKQIRTSLNKLKSTGEVTSKTTNKFTLLTIENYSKYQDKDNERASKKASNQTNEGQSKGNQRATNNNDNNVNNNNISAGAYSVLLNKNGVRTTPSHPTLINWESQKVSLDEIERAVNRSRQAGKTNINPNYLNAIIFSERETQQEPQDEKQDLWSRAVQFAKDNELEPFKGAPHETPQEFIARTIHAN